MKEYTLDAKNQSLGRLASKIAVILQGKNSPDYDPRLEGDARVIIKNINDLKFTGKKIEQKIYYHHTGRPGHLKERKLREVFSKSPEKLLKQTVAGMLPKNRLLVKRLKKIIFLKND
ncbi:MAG: 50S ribosomal protein L13 [Candidatus Liptonbacteria bacterium]|nr:50S ribosomal protein L13 [Candidatus Liptonbacteria bacterium]